MTFSIVGRTADGSHFGVAISSSSPAVAARCSHARAGVGAVASQNITDPGLGPAILARLDGGGDAPAALAGALASTPFSAYRQVLALGRTGTAAAHSGQHTLGVHATSVGEHCAAGGNLLASTEVPASMVRAFSQTAGHLGARLLSALRAGLDAGGEAGPVRSAGLLVVRDVGWPIVDLRVDWDERDPIGGLEAIWTIYAPQIDEYVQRALDPSRAPRFGVPGDP